MHQEGGVSQPSLDAAAAALEQGWPGQAGAGAGTGARAGSGTGAGAAVGALATAGAGVQGAGTGAGVLGTGGAGAGGAGASGTRHPAEGGGATGDSVAGVEQAAVVPQWQQRERRQVLLLLSRSRALLHLLESHCSRAPSSSSSSSITPSPSAPAGLSTAAAAFPGNSVAAAAVVSGGGGGIGVGAGTALGPGAGAGAGGGGVSEEEAWAQLASLAWCPVLRRAPDPGKEGRWVARLGVGLGFRIGEEVPHSMHSRCSRPCRRKAGCAHVGVGLRLWHPWPGALCYGVHLTQVRREGGMRSVETVLRNFLWLENKCRKRCAPDPGKEGKRDAALPAWV